MGCQVYLQTRDTFCSAFFFLLSPLSTKLSKIIMSKTGLMNCPFNEFAYLILVHSGRPGGLCTPCSRSVAPRWDTALHCDWAAAQCGGRALASRAGRVWHSRSKSSSRPRRSPELDVGTHSEGQRLLQDILCGSKQWAETQENVVHNANTDSLSSLCVQTWHLWANLQSA